MPNQEYGDTAAEQLARGLRHDLLTPVNAVTGLSQLLLDEVDGPLTQEQRVQVELIRDAAQSLTALIQTRLAQPKAGRGES